MNLMARIAARWAEVPRLLRFLGFHCAVGVVAGLAFAITLLATNAVGLRDVLLENDHQAVAVLMLLVMCALTFGSLSMGAAVMSLPRDDPGE